MKLCQISSVDPITLDGPFVFFGVVKWLLEEADKSMGSNAYLAARMLTQARDVASRISKMEVSCDQALLIIQWNLRQWTPPIYGNLHNADKRPRSRIIPYSLLYIATSV